MGSQTGSVWKASPKSHVFSGLLNIHREKGYAKLLKKLAPQGQGHCEEDPVSCRRLTLPPSGREPGGASPEMIMWVLEGDTGKKRL